MLLIEHDYTIEQLKSAKSLKLYPGKYFRLFALAIFY